VIETYPVTN